MPKLKSGNKKSSKSRSRNRTQNLKKKKKLKFKQKLKRTESGPVEEAVEDITYCATVRPKDWDPAMEYSKVTSGTRSKHTGQRVRRQDAGTQQHVLRNRKLDADVDEVCRRFQEVLRRPGPSNVRCEEAGLVEYGRVEQLARHVRDLILDTPGISTTPNTRSKDRQDSSMPPLVKEECLKLLKEIRTSL